MSRAYQTGGSMETARMQHSRNVTRSNCKDKVAIVTRAAGSGMGRSIALTISEAGGTMISGKCFKKMILPGLTGIIRGLLVYWIAILSKKRLHCTP